MDMQKEWGNTDSENNQLSRFWLESAVGGNK